MADVSASIGADPTTDIGWYLDMPRAGEKIRGNSITLNGQVIFTSYVPATAADECDAALGSGRVYAVNVLNGDPVVALGATGSAQSSSENLTITHRSKPLRRAGIASSPSVVFPDTGKATILVGTEVLGSVEVASPNTASSGANI